MPRPPAIPPLLAHLISPCLAPSHLRHFTLISSSPLIPTFFAWIKATANCRTPTAIRKIPNSKPGDSTGMPSMTGMKRARPKIKRRGPRIRYPAFAGESKRPMVGLWFLSDVWYELGDKLTNWKIKLGGFELIIESGFELRGVYNDRVGVLMCFLQQYCAKISAWDWFGTLY